MTNEVEAVTFDWYGTLATHRHKIGRGKLFLQYLVLHGLQAAPWDHTMLYEVFEYYGEAYRLDFSDGEALTFWTEFTRLLFQRAQVTGLSFDQIHRHAAAMRDIFGPGAFELYPDVFPVLNALKQQGIRLAIVSNWPRGLKSFCYEMDLSHFFDAVISSADIGFEKPDPRIFSEALRLIRIDASRAVHVGDTMDEDIVGAIGAGLRAILIDRENVYDGVENRISSLYALEDRLRLAD